MYEVWIDQDVCTGDGLCTDHCPDVFVLLDKQVVDAALACPGECLFIEVGGSGAPTERAAESEHDRGAEHPGSLELPRRGDSLDDPDVGDE